MNTKGTSSPAAPQVAASDEADKEKKRRRRSNRRGKQNPAPGVGACGSVDGDGTNNVAADLRGEASSPMRASHVVFNSLPNVHLDSGEEGIGDQQAGFTAPSGFMMEGKISKSFPLPSGDARPSSSLTLTKVNGEWNGATKRKYFDPHWSEQDVNTALEKGLAFRAVFRVNAYNRLEAYCTVDGLPVDVLINGAPAQNRAVEGDVVAITLDPVACWMKLKGANDQLNGPIPVDDSVVLPGEVEGIYNIRNDRVGADFENPNCSKNLLPRKNGSCCHEKECINEPVQSGSGNGFGNANFGGHSTMAETSAVDYAFEKGEGARALGRICAIMSSYPSKRPTGRVIAIIERSHRRDAIVGFLSVQQVIADGKPYGKQACGQMLRQSGTYGQSSAVEYIILIPTSSKFLDMVVSVTDLPDNMKERLDMGDLTLETELVAARMNNWHEESLLPQAQIIHTLGQGRETETHIAAILFENAICNSDFSPESLSCLPDVPWKIPPEELKSRRDLRHLCTFTIDPSSAVDLDDALSVEKLSDDVYRIGVHIADVSYFVLPDTAIDTEAQIRSTSVYISRRKLPMLPPRLSKELGSLIPGVDKLAFSIIWDISFSGDIINQWIGHTVIHSCCKLSYEYAQGIIDGSLVSNHVNFSAAKLPALHGRFEWKDIVESVITLNEISVRLKKNRLKDGALTLDSCKLKFLFDDCGTPYEGIFDERKDSNFLVEEFMLLANKTAAEVISRAYPECALLRRHPEPNLRKLKEFKALCSKLGFELDSSSSGQLHISLTKIKERLKHDPFLFDILVSYASKPMQLATYFCTGDLKNREVEWAHYSLAVPLYTHFTSPLRRYPDVVVHRILSAVVEAEEIYMQHKTFLSRKNGSKASGGKTHNGYFTGLIFDKAAAESNEGRKALSAAALKYKVPGVEVLSVIAAYCNDRKLASRYAEDAADKVYMWAMLRKKEILISEARVTGLGPRFMSVYIQKLAIERRIYYNEVEGLAVEWLETTSTLVLDLLRNKRFQKRGHSWKTCALEDVTLVINPSELPRAEENGKPVENSDVPCLGSEDTAGNSDTHPAFFPLALRLLSTIPVVLHAAGGEDCPPDIGVRLYMCSYFR